LLNSVQPVLSGMLLSSTEWQRFVQCTSYFIDTKMLLNHL
jgi:hypothetical protein